MQGGNAKKSSKAGSSKDYGLEKYDDGKSGASAYRMQKWDSGKSGASAYGVEKWGGSAGKTEETQQGN